VSSSDPRKSAGKASRQQERCELRLRCLLGMMEVRAVFGERREFSKVPRLFSLGEQNVRCGARVSSPERSRRVGLDQIAARRPRSALGAYFVAWNCELGPRKVAVCDRRKIEVSARERLGSRSTSKASHRLGFDLRGP